MKPKLKIGIVGCGAIGTSLALYIKDVLAVNAGVSLLYDIDLARARALSLKISPRKCIVAADVRDVCSQSDLVVEAASALCAWPVAKAVLREKRDCMIMSVGGLIGHIKQLYVLARRSRARVYIPSGALCGVDGLKAGRAAGIRSVVLTTKKNPHAFKGVAAVERKGISLENITEDTVLFNGTAESAVKYFPQNINVAAVLSIAGIGAPKTRVKIIASPSIHKNVHEVEIIGAAGRIFTRTENVIHPDNPKTSYLAFLSAAEMLRQIVDPVRIGT